MSYPAGDWREGRRESARAAIVEAAWAAVADEGLAGLSLRDLARRAGTTTPTIYKYFGAKHDIYDAMFGRAALQFEQCMAAPFAGDEPRDALLECFRRFIDFCVGDIPRYQLLFQRTIPGFEPSAESYAPAVRALDVSVAALASSSITDRRLLDLWTAMTTGLVDQQIANDPGGDRWTRLADEVVTMFLDHCRSAARTDEKRRSRSR